MADPGAEVLREGLQSYVRGVGHATRRAGLATRAGGLEHRIVKLYEAA